MLIDTHCHLTLAQFRDDLPAVLDRAEAAGVAAMVTIGIDLEHSRAALDLAERHPAIYAAVGVHPNDSGDFDSAALAELRRLAVHPRVVAIGEIGLDNHWQRVSTEQQRRAFRQQLDLAAELGLPVVIHDREAHEAIGEELRAWVRDRLPGTALAKRPFLGVLHSFSGDLSLAAEAYDWNFVLGLSGPITFKNAHDLHTLAAGLRPDRVVIETDAPFLAPHPHRGQRNEPAHVRLVAAKLAELWQMPVEQVAARTTTTARTLFSADL